MTDQTPPEEPTSAFEALLADPLEQFDKRSEILASIDAYSKAVPSTASTQRPQSTTVTLYTASEVKVLTETATRVAYALGRKDALTEIADEMAVEQEYLSYTTFQTDRDTALLLMAAKTSSRAAGATSDATSGVPGHQEVSEAVRSPQEPADGGVDPCNCDLAPSEPLDHKPGSHHLPGCPRWTPEGNTP